MVLFYNIAFLKSIGGSDQVEVRKDAVYRAALDVSGAGNNSKIHTSFHSPCYPPSNFLDIHQLSRDLGPILHSSLMNILLHVSDRKFSSVNITACFISSFPYRLLQNPYPPHKVHTSFIGVSYGCSVCAHEQGFAAVCGTFPVLPFVLGLSYSMAAKALLHTRSWRLNRWSQK